MSTSVTGSIPAQASEIVFGPRGVYVAGIRISAAVVGSAGTPTPIEITSMPLDGTVAQETRSIGDARTLSAVTPFPTQKLQISNNALVPIVFILFFDP